MRRAAALVLAAAFGLLAACASATPPSPGPLAVALPPPPLAFWTLHGQPADRRTIQLHRPGATYCGPKSTMYLTLPNPTGADLTEQNARRYVRDPEGVYRAETAGDFEPAVALPPDAGFTGYRYGSMELWLSPATADEAAYLGRDGIWERWPRVLAIEGGDCN